MAGRFVRVSALALFWLVLVELGALSAVVMPGSGGSTTLFVSVWNEAFGALEERSKSILMMYTQCRDFLKTWLHPEAILASVPTRQCFQC